MAPYEVTGAGSTDPRAPRIRIPTPSDTARSTDDGTGEAPAVLLVGDWRVDVAARSATDGTNAARLSPRAVRLLQVLASAPGEALSRQRLLDAVWPDVFVGDESLTQTVTELRRVMGGRIIETIPKHGYRLVAPVEAGAGGDAVQPKAAADGFDLGAYQLCLDARQALMRGGPGAISQPATLTAEAVARAPQFAMARAEYAIALTYLWLYQRDDHHGLDQAVAEAEQAVRLRPDLAIAHAAMGFALGAAGRHGEMRRSLERAMARDANDAEVHMLATRALFAARDYRCTAALAERAAMLNTDDFRPLYFAARSASLFDPLRGRRNAQACLARIRARLALDPSEPRALNTLGPVYTLLGLPDEAVRAVESQGCALSPCQFYDSIAYSAVGDWDRATESFASVVENGWRHADWLTAEPSLGPFRDHPRFHRVARSIGLA